MKATTVQQAAEALESGSGPVEITATLARDLAKHRPEFFNGWARAQRLAAFGGGPYFGAQFGAHELRVLPDPDPMSRAEVKARGKFDKKLAETREHEEVARAAYEVAERAYLDLYGRSLAVGDTWGVSAIGRLIQHERHRDIGEAERRTLKAEVAAAKETWDEARDAFGRATVKLNATEGQIDQAARQARA